MSTYNSECKDFKLFTGVAIQYALTEPPRCGQELRAEAEEMGEGERGTWCQSNRE